MATLPVANGRLHGRTSSYGTDPSHARSVLQDRVARHHPRCDPPGVARRTARVSCVQLAKTAENLDLGCRKLSLEEFRMAVDAL
jgi:hypothetical protein